MASPGDWGEDFAYAIDTYDEGIGLRRALRDDRGAALQRP